MYDPPSAFDPMPPRPTTAAEQQRCDAEILRLGEELDAVKAECARVEHDDKAFNAAMDCGHAIALRIAAIPATSPEALHVKTRALLWSLDDNPIDHEIQASGRTESMLLHSVLNDAFAAAGVHEPTRWTRKHPADDAMKIAHARVREIAGAMV